MCTSHDVYLAIADSSAFKPVSNASRVDKSARADEASQIAILILIGVVSVCLLTFGSRFVVATLSFVVFLASFWIWYGILDSLSYDDAGVANFSMCVLPLVVAILLGFTGSMVVVCLFRRIEWLGALILGAAVGAIAMYIVRLIILSADPSLASNRYFAWYWAGLIVVAAICGWLATTIRVAIFMVASTVVGGYGFATFVCGLVPVLGGEPLGVWIFIIIEVAATLAGGIVQFWMSQRDKPDGRDIAYKQ